MRAIFKGRIDMRMQQIFPSLAVSVACGAVFATPAVSQEYKGTWEQQMACTPDVFRLCGEQIPDADRIVICLRQNTPQLSAACRSVFDSSANAAQQSPPKQALSKRRDIQQDARSSPAITPGR
jgi:hypothetical protein